MIVSSPSTLPSPPWQVPCFPSFFLWGIVPDAFRDWNILIVAFLGRIDKGPSQLLLLYALCLHRPMKSLYPNTANVICTRAVKECGPGHPSGTWALVRSPTGLALTSTFGQTFGLNLGRCVPVGIIREGD